MQCKLVRGTRLATTVAKARLALYPLSYVVQMVDEFMQRRCIHDAFGNEDPVKVRETAIPRPHARKSNILAKEKAKAQKVADAKAPEVDYAYKQQAYRAPNPVVLADQAPRVAPVANMVAQPPDVEMHSNMFPTSPEASEQRSIAERATQLLDPALFADQKASFFTDGIPLQMSPPTTTFAPMGPSQDATLAEACDNAEGHSYPSNEAQDTTYNSAPVEPQESFERPASSLVSPPASIHDDDACKVSNSPDASWSACDPVAQSAVVQEEPMQQRYTPDSGSMDGASLSPRDKAMPEEDMPAHVQEPRPTPSLKTAVGSDFQADEDSLKLIKELQAQELGLRRRGKV